MSSFWLARAQPCAGRADQGRRGEAVRL